jgi:hypothetical protein
LLQAASSITARTASHRADVMSAIGGTCSESARIIPAVR